VFIASVTYPAQKWVKKTNSLAKGYETIEEPIGYFSSELGISIAASPCDEEGYFCNHQ
jgi:hypothetical protein